MGKTFGNNLKAIREMNHFSQRQLAELLCTSQQRISEWESDKIEPNLYSIIKLLKALNVTFEELTEGININR